ncbi:MAG: hypothetical protein IKM20_09005 [Erysipelotrichales bacterium]|nr:hypothetical protein [Erysipelotrichales bacterium]
MRKHLYSLIGINDPTSEQEPIEIGSILRILSEEKFDKLYLFRTHEIMNRSNYKLKETRLKEIIKDQYGIPVIIGTLPKQDSNLVGEWKDIFHNSIKSCIEQENDADDILWYVNFSIGTPIMISSLTHAILTINEPIFAIYSNEEILPQTKKYDVSKKQIIAKINEQQLGVTVASVKQLQETEVMTQIERLIQIHDYHAASVLLGEFKSTYYETLRNMCDGADALTKLHLDNARKSFTFTPLRHIFKNKIPKEIFQLVVYVNNLEAKMADNEYFDFVMRTSPLLYELCSLILVEYTHFPKNAISLSENYSTEVIKRKDMHIIPTAFKRYFEGYFKKNPSAEQVVVTTPLLIHLISYQLTSSMSITNELLELRNFEEKIRNEFAHVFSEYTEDYIYKKTGKYPSEILELYKKVIKKIAYQYVNDDSLFTIYQDINQTIIDYVEVSKDI